MRKCSKCNARMSSGYIFDEGLDYYCSDECLHTVYTPEDVKEMQSVPEDDWVLYWTDWEDECEECGETNVTISMDVQGEWYHYCSQVCMNEGVSHEDYLELLHAGVIYLSNLEPFSSEGKFFGVRLKGEDDKPEVEHRVTVCPYPNSQDVACLEFSNGDVIYRMWDDIISYRVLGGNE